MTQSIAPYRLAGWGLAVVILLIPAIAMNFTDEVRWTGGDFLAMGLMLLVAGLAIELVVRTIASGKLRMVAAVGVVALFLLLWAELAVGILPG